MHAELGNQAWRPGCLLADKGLSSHVPAALQTEQRRLRFPSDLHIESTILMQTTQHALALSIIM